MKLKLILLGLAASRQAFAATRSVSSQYSTIQAAINAAAVNDTISIANGTYNEILVIPIAKAGLKFVGASQTGEVIQSGANSTTLTVHAANTTAGVAISLSGRASWVKRLTAAQVATYTRGNGLGGWNPPLL